MASTASALRVLALGPLVALAVAGGMSACGGTSVKHVDDGGTGSGASGGTHQGGTGGTGSGGTGGGVLSPFCERVGDYAGLDSVDWNVPPETPCAMGETEWCFDPGDPMLQTCMDAGVPAPSPSGDAAPRPPDCPNVRYLCRTVVGCCEDAAMLVAGPRSKYVESGGRCCYLAMPGVHER